MLAALICGVLLGLANPGPGCLADKLYVSKISTFGIFVISGWVSHDIEHVFIFFLKGFHDFLQFGLGFVIIFGYRIDIAQ